MFEGKVILSSHDAVPAGLWVVQPWPTSPMLWRHHRFILRTWLAMPSVLPLRLYMLQDAWAHIVAKPYRSDQLFANYKDHCVHLWSTEACAVTHAHRILRSNHEGMRPIFTTSCDGGLGDSPACAHALARLPGPRLPAGGRLPACGRARAPSSPHRLALARWRVDPAA